MEVTNAEGTSTNKQRLEVLQEQEELIKDENKQEAKAKEIVGVVSSVKDDVNIDDKEEIKRADAETEHTAEAVEEGNGANEDVEKEPKEDTRK